MYINEPVLIHGYMGINYGWLHWIVRINIVIKMSSNINNNNNCSLFSLMPNSNFVQHAVNKNTNKQTKNTFPLLTLKDD